MQTASTQSDAMLMNGTSVETSQQMMTRCLFWRDVVVFTNFCDWPSVDPDLPTAPYDYRKIFRLLSNVNFCWVVDNKNTAGPIKRPRSSTNTLLHSITGTVASCYKSHRLSTCLRPLNYVVLFTTITRRFNVRPYFLQTSPSTVVRDVIN